MNEESPCTWLAAALPLLRTAASAGVGLATTCWNASVCGRLLELVGDVGADGAEQDRQEHRHAQRAADLAEEGRRAGGDADLGRGYGALHDQQQRLHAVAEPHAEHQHEEVDRPAARCRPRWSRAAAGRSPARPTRPAGSTRVRPVRAMMLPETIAPDIMPSTIGSISSPAMVGDAPCTICMYSGRIRMPPNIAAPIATLAQDGRPPRPGSGTAGAGSARRRPSPARRGTNATSPSAPTTYAVIERAESQPHSRPCSATVSSGTRATTSAVAPHQSIRT